MAVGELLEEFEVAFSKVSINFNVKRISGDEISEG